MGREGKGRCCFDGLELRRGDWWREREMGVVEKSRGILVMVFEF